MFEVKHNHILHCMPSRAKYDKVSTHRTGEISLTSQKTHAYILVAAVVAFVLLCENVVVAAEMTAFEALCMERGMSSFDVKPLVTVKLHGVPNFMRDQPRETQPSQNVPIKEIPSETPAPQVHKPDDAKTKVEPEKPVEAIKNMRIVVSGDEVALRTSDNALKDSTILKPVPAVVSHDVIIPYPEAVKPQVTPAPPANTVAQGKMMWPVSGSVSSGFGRRGRRGHSGLDMPMPLGTPIVAAMDGVVVETATSSDKRYRGYGNTVLIDHGNGLATLYAHCSKINVKKGQMVKQGDVVALVGNTGRATTNHIHFEVRQNGRAVDPVPYLASR